MLKNAVNFKINLIEKTIGTIFLFYKKIKIMSKFTIPKPCHENWDKMLPEEKGKFCASCQKSVHDFTQSSSQEIKNIFEKENGNICGRFREDQLLHFSKFQNMVLRIERFSQNNFSKFGILISAVSLLMSISGCQKKEELVGLALPNKDESDSTNCKIDSTNLDTILGEVIEPRQDSAQIPKQNTKKDLHSKSDTVKPPKKITPIEHRPLIGKPIQVPEK